MNFAPALLWALSISACAYFAGDHQRNNAWLAKQGVAERDARVALQVAQARGDRLSNALLSAERQIDQQRTEIQHALNKTTRGSPCLNGATLRVLKQAPGIVVSSVPQPTGSAAAAGEPPGASGDRARSSTDTGNGTAADAAWYSTDTQIANWIAEAGAAYGVCRSRLDALIDWHAP